jgi:hypothetical protein
MNVVANQAAPAVVSEHKNKNNNGEPKLRTFIYTEKYRHVTVTFSTNASPAPAQGANQLVVVRYGATTYRPEATIVPRDPQAPDYDQDNIFDPKDKFQRKLLPKGLKQVPSRLPAGFKRNFRHLRMRHREESESRYWRAPSFGVINLAKYKPPAPGSCSNKSKLFPAWFKQQVRNLLYTQGNYGERVTLKKKSQQQQQPQLECPPQEQPSVQLEQAEDIPRLLEACE